MDDIISILLSASGVVTILFVFISEINWCLIEKSGIRDAY